MLIECTTIIKDLYVKVNILHLVRWNKAYSNSLKYLAIWSAETLVIIFNFFHKLVL
jgi:hypothetical protein